MSRVQVDLKQAVEFAAQGFEIECYVLPQKHQPTTKTKKKLPHERNASVRMSDIVTLSLDGAPPTQGNIGRAWPGIRNELWGDDITKSYTASRVKDVLLKHGAKPWDLTYLIHTSHVIRKLHQ